MGYSGNPLQPMSPQQESSNSPNGNNHPSDGPSAHEDLTIAEILETVRADAGSAHPGQHGYRRDKGKVVWLDQKKADAFLKRHGAEHPGDYQDHHGHDWEDDFFHSDSIINPPTMNTENQQSAVSSVKEAAENVRQKTHQAYDTARDEATEWMGCCHDAIRKNPLPAVAGAFAFGIAIGCLIMSGRHQETFQERYLHDPLADAGDAISKSLDRLRGNLKFW